MNGLKYDIMVVDDDPLVLEDTVMMYKEMLQFGDLKDVFGNGSAGSVSAAKNTKEAEGILHDHFKTEPGLIQLLHLDQRMPEETGADFADRIRRIYTLENIGALLVTGYATDVSVLNSREKGIYRYIPKPVSAETIRPHLEDLVEMIMLKEKPRKKQMKDVFCFRIIQDEERLLQLLKLRYFIWNKLGYIPPEFRSDKSKLEIDDYDKYSIHVGGFLISEKGERIVSGARVITLDKQQATIKRFEKILREYKDDVLIRAFEKDIDAPLPIFLNYNPTDFISAFPAGTKYGEYSRLMCDPSYRGLNLAPRITQMVHYTAKYELGLRLGLAECLVRHVEMNVNNLGFSGIIPQTDIRNVDRVEQIANAIYVDLNEFDNAHKNEFNSEFRAISDKLRETAIFAIAQTQIAYRVISSISPQHVLNSKNSKYYIIISLLVFN